MNLLRKILLPIVPVYYIVTSIRNYLYDKGVFKSKSYNLPVICIGNLSVGGTGKSPMTEYVIRLLKDNYKVATLSRGYRRKTKGFLLATKTTISAELGDEPFQMHNKFADINVAVDEDRQHGIETLIGEVNPDVILLDDAYQHRRVSAGMNILLTTYDNLYVKDWLLPTGDLRESKKGANRAHFIVVTKCPENLSEEEKNNVRKQLNVKAQHQQVFFSTIAYSKTVVSNASKVKLDEFGKNHFTLVTGIANPKPLLDYLNKKDFSFEHLNYKDHHNFSDAEIEMLNTKELILTTEKDFVRLKDTLDSDKLFYLEIQSTIDNKTDFNNGILDFVESFTQ